MTLDLRRSIIYYIWYILFYDLDRTIDVYNILQVADFILGDYPRSSLNRYGHNIINKV